MKNLISGINHFGLSVGDLDQSINFYTEILDLKISEKRKHDCFFSLGKHAVMALIQYPGGQERFDEEMRPNKKGKGYTHFGFQASSAQDVFEMQDHLIANKVEIITSAYERWDGASLYFLDPNGYTLEFIYFDSSKSL